MILDLLKTIDLDQVADSLPLDAPELDTMRSLAEQGDYAGMAELAVQLAERHVYDIRVLVYALYGETQGVTPLLMPDFCDAVEYLLEEAWEALSPANKKGAYCKSSLAWLFKQMLIDLQTQELDAGDIWNEWMESLQAVDMTESILRLGGLIPLIDEKLGKEATTVTEKLTELKKWLTQLSQSLPSRQDAERVAEAEATPEAVANSPESRTGPMQSGLPGGSVHFDILLRKLAFFERVVESGDMVKAAVVVADLSTILENFDPRLYFPSLFSRYFTLLVTHNGAINEVMGMRDSPQWQALESLYKVDDEAFLAVPVEPVIY